MKRASRTDDIVYRYSRQSVTKEELVQSLKACSNPTLGCTGCIYHQMHVRGCIAKLMEDAIHVLESDMDSCKE